MIAEFKDDLTPVVNGEYVVLGRGLQLPKAIIGQLKVNGDFTVGGDVVFSGAVTFAGDVEFLGSVYQVEETVVNQSFQIGTGLEDRLVINSEIQSDLLPQITTPRDLGSDTRRWEYVYANYGDFEEDVRIGGDLSVEGDADIDGKLTVGGEIDPTNIKMKGGLYIDPTGVFPAGSQVITSSRNLQNIVNATIGGTITAGSGAVQLTDATGKIQAISATYFASLDGSSLTSLNATQLTSGTVPSGRLSGVYSGVTGLGTQAQALAMGGNSITGVGANITASAGLTIGSGGGADIRLTPAGRIDINGDMEFTPATVNIYNNCGGAQTVNYEGANWLDLYLKAGDNAFMNLSTYIDAGVYLNLAYSYTWENEIRTFSNMGMRVYFVPTAGNGATCRASNPLCELRYNPSAVGTGVITELASMKGVHEIYNQYSNSAKPLIYLENASSVASAVSLELAGTGNRIINSTSGNLTIRTTTSGDIILNPAGNLKIGALTGWSGTFLTGDSPARTVTVTKGIITDVS